MFRKTVVYVFRSTDEREGVRSMRRKATKMAAAGSLLLAATSQAWGVNIGGVEIPLGLTFSSAQIYTSLPQNVGDPLAGYGKIESINSASVSNLCGGDCELTYVFDGYTVTSANAATGELLFTGGSVRVYLGTGADNDFSTQNPGSSPADDVAEASNGTLWLTLAAHPIDGAGNTFRSVGTNVGTPAFTGSGQGLLDVSGSGAANAFFDSNSVPAAFGGNADFQIVSTFSGVFTPYPDTAAGAASLFTTAVPEPETYALMLSALGLIGYVVHRRRRV
jgi:hypothetical protein